MLPKRIRPNVIALLRAVNSYGPNALRHLHHSRREAAIERGWIDRDLRLTEEGKRDFKQLNLTPCSKGEA